MFYVCLRVGGEVRITCQPRRQTRGRRGGGGSSCHQAVNCSCWAEPGLDAAPGMSLQPRPRQSWHWNTHSSSLVVYQIPVWPFVVTFLSAVWCMINKSAGSLFFISVTSRHPQHSSYLLLAPCNAVTNINMWSRLQKQCNGVPLLQAIFKLKMCCAILSHV